MKIHVWATVDRVASPVTRALPCTMAAVSLALCMGASAGTADNGPLDRVALARAAARTAVPAAAAATAGTSVQPPATASTSSTSGTANDTRKQDLRNAFSAKPTGEARHLNAQERAQLRQQLRQDLRAQRTDDSAAVKR